MKKTTKIVSVFLLTGFFALQLWHTTQNSVHWPIMPTNLFFKRSSFDCSYLYVKLFDSHGGELLVQARHCLPLESFRLQGIFKEVLERNSDTKQQRAMSALILKYLNQGGWTAFDEIYPAASPPTKTHFIAFDLLRCDFDLRDYKPGTEARPIRTQTVYSYSEA